MTKENKKINKSPTTTLSLNEQEKQDLKLIALKKGFSATGLVRKWIKDEKEKEGEKNEKSCKYRKR